MLQHAYYSSGPPVSLFLYIQSIYFRATKLYAVLNCGLAGAEQMGRTASLNLLVNVDLDMVDCLRYRGALLTYI